MRTEFILEPGRYDGVPVSHLLEAAGRGYIAFDRRVLHAILDRGQDVAAELARFAAEEHTDHAIQFELVLADMFRHLGSPLALPLLLKMVRSDPVDVDDGVIEAIAQLGRAAVDPLIELLDELGDAAGDVPFILSALHVRDARILEALTARLADAGPDDLLDAVLSLDVYGDPAAIPALEAAKQRCAGNQQHRRDIQAAIDTLSARGELTQEPPDPFDIWKAYPETAPPCYDVLGNHELLAMLNSDSAELRAGAAGALRTSEPPLAIRARMIELARTDSDVGVRCECWETLGDVSDEPELRRVMLEVLRDANAPVEERGSVAVALAQQSDNAAIFEAIEALYSDPGGCAKALKAMARSQDRRFAAYPPKHLDDPDPAIQREAVWGIGYLNLSSEAARLVRFFEQDDRRSDALFAYALSVPGETSRGRIPALLRKIEQVAGGFNHEEEELVKVALDQRLMLHGKEPYFFRDEDGDEKPAATPVAKETPGRNDPCPCGSGKKYKKCCGA